MSNLPTLDYSADEFARLAPGERAGALWMVTLVGIGASFMVSALFATVKLAGAPQQSPATQVSFSARETVTVNVVVPGAVIAAIVLVSVTIRPGGLRRLGLGAERIPLGAALGLLAALVIVPLVHGSGQLTEEFWRRVGLEHPTAHPLLRAGDEMAEPMLRALIMLSAVVLAPAAEELLFRGHLQTAMLYSFDRPGTSGAGRWGAIVLSSIVFTIFHGELWMMPPIFLLSLCLGFVYEWTRNLWTPIVIHALFNASSVVYYFWYHASR
jgi:membrane protease YdiL (CAAX protease family)